MRLGDLDALREEISSWGCNDYDKYDFIEAIDNAPTVCGNNPKWCESCVSKGKCASTRPQGEWNYIQAGMAICPFCGATPHKQYKNFCPKCGAKMLGGSK